MDPKVKVKISPKKYDVHNLRGKNLRTENFGHPNVSKDNESPKINSCQFEY
jgi:hypothetical protein